MYRTKHRKETNNHKNKNNHHNNHHHHSLLGSVFRRKGHRRHSSNMSSSVTSAPVPLSFTDATSASSDVSEETNSEIPIAPPPISVERAVVQASVGDDGDDLSTIKEKSRLITSSHELRRMYTNPENLEVLENGGVLFAFVCHHALTPYEADMVDSTINISGFDDEETENYVPRFEYEAYQQQLRQQEQQALDRSSSSSLSQRSVPKFTFLLTRCGYLLTGFDLQKLIDNPQIVTSLEYQRSCQPEGTRIWDDLDKMDADNFRMTKPIIPYIYSFTIQFRVSRVDNQEDLQRLSQHLRVPVHGAIVLERTKRSVPPKEDATRKIKSILAYTDMGHGVVLVSHLTVMLQAGLPEIIERILGTIGKWGLGETAETAWRTRQYLQTQLPYVPKEQAIFLDAASEIEKQATISEPEISSSDDEDAFFDAVDDVDQDLSSGVADLTVH